MSPEEATAVLREQTEPIVVMRRLMVYGYVELMCGLCGEEKPLSEFYDSPHRRGLAGKRYACKVCMRKRAVERLKALS